MYQYLIKLSEVLSSSRLMSCHLYLEVYDSVLAEGLCSVADLTSFVLL